MNEEEATRLLNRRAEEVPDSHAPVMEVIAAGHAAQRKKLHRATVAGVALAASVVGGVVVQQVTSDGTAPTSERPSFAETESSSTAKTGGGSAAPERLLDPLTYTLLLGSPRGDRRGERLTSTIRVENHSGDTVTDPGCLVGANYSFGVVRTTQSDVRLPGRLITYCSGAQGIPDGYSETLHGPTFSLRGLPPGEYLAAIDFGDSRSQRLFAEFTIGSS